MNTATSRARSNVNPPPPVPPPAGETGADGDDTLVAPRALLMLLEARAPLEYAARWAASPLLRRLPAGDGHPVIVFPGLGANDLTTATLRNFLRKRGYTPYAWQQGFNLGPRRGVLDACSAQVQIAARHGQTLSFIGWSLGGLYACKMAKLHADHWQPFDRSGARRWFYRQRQGADGAAASHGPPQRVLPA